MRSTGKFERVLLVIILIFVLHWVFGWLPEDFQASDRASRAAEHEITTTTASTTKTQPEVFLLIMILASEKGLDRRTAVRETWASALPPSTRLCFLIGGRSLASPMTLQEEQAQFGDLLILPGVQDTYNALTTKLLKGFVAITTLYPNFRFLLKADDDSFARVELLIAELRHFPPYIKLNWGYFDGRAPVRRGGKWAEKEWVLADTYLPYSLGGGYVLSAPVVHFVAQNAHLWRLYNSEDVSLGSWLAGLDIERHHDLRFDTEWKSRGCQNKFIVTHKQTPQMMRDKHAQLMRTGNKELCAKETFVRPEYVYNWNSLPCACCPGRGKN